jgi:carboxyl-terminal processing protease
MQPGRDGEPRAGKLFPAPRILLLISAAALVLVGVFAAKHRLRSTAIELRPNGQVAPSVEAPAPPIDSAEEPEERAMALPSGAPTRISCEDAARVTRYIERELAAPPIAPTPGELADAWGGMLDPHGLWSASPDSPVHGELLAAASVMLDDLTGHTAGCLGAERVARVWMPWQEQLQEIFDRAFEAARAIAPPSDADLYSAVADPIYEDDPVTRPATELSRELGRRLGIFVARFPGEAAIASQARARFFPTGFETLRDVATLAALRAYVPLVDPHGDFAPIDEEWALYAGDDTLDSGSALWGEVTRTPLGARIVDDPTAPLELDDVVLSINGLTLAGASLDQIEQAARSTPAAGQFELRVLRQGQPALLALSVKDDPTQPSSGLDVERVAYGAKSVLRIGIADVADDLGRELSEALAEGTTDAAGVLLDLRGNGGGSLDAAVESLGWLIPGARLFPLIHRGSVTEVLQADAPAGAYTGPLSVLVDGDTASAAEMLAGAVQAYQRGTLIGVRTFGKGCVQEYFDDVVSSGVLRMTTLQFVMPDGRPLQQIGLTPELSLPLPPASERESQITRQPITFEGPDVRDRRLAPGPAWPKLAGAVGPCADPVVCQALSRLSGVRPGTRVLPVGRAPSANETSNRPARPRAGTR